jgi:hypothetical protein
MAAFLGALDDIAAVTITPDTTVGAEFTERVLGLFDTASTFYKGDMARNIELVHGLASRLGKLGCGGHDHISAVGDLVNDKYGLDRDDHSGHDHDKAEDHEDRHKKQKKKQPPKYGWPVFVMWSHNRAAH